MAYSNVKVREIIAEWINSERDRRIMERRLCDGIPLEKLAEEFQMSTRQIERITKKLSIEIFSHY